MNGIRLGINGAAGRMGQRLVALGSQDANLQIAAALERPGHPRLGQDAGLAAGVGELGVPLTDEMPAGLDVVIDFSVPESAVQACRDCRRHRTSLVLATTGLTEQQQQEVAAAAHEIPVVAAPNMSLAVNLTMKLAMVAAAALRDKSADVEIIDRHHRFKEDAPSGTALKFGELIAGVMGQSEHQHGRCGNLGQRPANQIGYHALRVGDNPGEHTIVFGMLGETIELTVRATSRDCYALGALAAAKFVANQSPGLYGMADVLGIPS